MFDMIERQKRGRLCFVGSQRHVKANNKYFDNFDDSKPSNYLMYWDANNLYGWAMSQHLQNENLKFDDAITLDDILDAPDENKTGYIIEVDLIFPKEIHDKLKEFPPCPESLTPKMEWFSEVQKYVGETNKIIKKR